MDEYLYPLSYEVRTVGEFAYVLYSLMKTYGQNEGFAGMAAMMGCIDACQREYYKQVMGPYEDVKRKDNGDVGF